MKKTNIYEAPVAEVIEMQMPVVLMDSTSTSTTGGSGTGSDPFGGGGFGGGSLS